MAPPFDLPHIDITNRRVRRRYQAPRESRGGGGGLRIRQEHGRRLSQQLSASFAAADQSRAFDPRLPAPDGVYLEVELRPGGRADALERKRDNVRPGATKVLENERRTIALLVPDAAREVLTSILEDYTSGPLSEAGNPPMSSVVEPIEAIRQARLETLWTDDPDFLPQAAGERVWWQLWTWGDTAERVADVAAELGARVAARDLWHFFPEAVVVPVLATRAEVELLTFAAVGISELRRGSDTPTFFTEDVREEQGEWVDDLAGRVTWPGREAPAVCLFDTGVNRAHPLIEPALSEDSMSAVRVEWGTDDHDLGGHGTRMAGLALHGDLTPLLADQRTTALRHRLESVKLLPPNGFDENDPRSYGVITQAAVALPEITHPERQRTFCMAITNDNVSGSRPTTWSAAIDQAAAGVMPGDDDDAPKRLFVLSSGNAPPHIDRSLILDSSEYPIEDPAQAWNAVTVGGYTDKIEISEEDLAEWVPFAEAGDLSPHTRTSVSWPQSKCPYKPELVMEAGNRAVSPAETEVLTPDSLCVLSTGRDVGRMPLAAFAATSASSAQVGRLAARLSADHPDYWPEMVRALLVHSAEWTEVMRSALHTVENRRAAYILLRKYGYGVPDYDRATASARNNLALTAQATIQPYAAAGGRRFEDCHFYRLPWPTRVLETLGDREVQLKITLSYFVEPNPGFSSNIDPQRYQSYGLRFDLKRRAETLSEFLERVNAMEREDPLAPARAVADDPRWLFGPRSVAAGSLHSDVWRGPAVELTTRDAICIRPVMGWWRQRADRKICERLARYALVATIRSDDERVDLHTPIQTIVQAGIGVEIPF